MIPHINSIVRTTMTRWCATTCAPPVRHRPTYRAKADIAQQIRWQRQLLILLSVKRSSSRLHRQPRVERREAVSRNDNPDCESLACFQDAGWHQPLARTRLPTDVITSPEIAHPAAAGCLALAGPGVRTSCLCMHLRMAPSAIPQQGPPPSSCACVVPEASASFASKCPGGRRNEECVCLSRAWRFGGHFAPCRR